MEHPLRTLFYILFLLNIIYLPNAKGQGGDFKKLVIIKDLPVPQEKNQLFYLQRDPDANTVIYQLNLKNDQLDHKKPVIAYWIQYEQGGTKKPLNYIQRTMAYGIHSRSIGKNEFDLEIAAYKQLDLNLKYSTKHQKYLVTTTIKGRKAILDQLFVRIIGGTVFNPNIAYYMLKGRDYSTNTRLEHEIKP